MKRLLRWALGLLLILAILMVLGLMFKDSVLRIVAEHKIRSQTGMEARIGNFSSGFFSPAVTIRDLKLYNTPDFGRTLFLDIPELHLEIDKAALERHELHFTVVRFHLREIDLVRNAAGQTNVFSILNKAQARETGNSGAPKLLKGFSPTGIDELELTIEKYRFIDLKDAANNREQDLNIQHQVFKNVNSTADFSGVLLLLWLRSRGSLPLSHGP